MKSYLDKRFFVGAAAGFVIASAIGLGLFQCARSAFLNPEKRAEWVVRHLKHELDLDDAQMQHLQRIKNDILGRRSQMKALKKEIRAEFVAQIRSGTVDEAKLNRLFDQKNAPVNEMRRYMISKFSEFHGMLTPEQRQKLGVHVNEFMERHEESGYWP